MAQDIVRSPMQDLNDALGTLERLIETHAGNRPPVVARLQFLINTLEADFNYLMDPTKRLVLSPKDRGPKR